jgi:carotenoid cleavage dioxygenase-like enzyme
MSGHASLHRNLQRPHGFEALEVAGTLPEDLVGTLVRVGPGLFERFGVRVSHPFEADGVVSAVRFDGNGGAVGAARVIESAGYRAEQAAGRRLYGAGAPWLRQLRNSLGQRSKNTANTSAWVWNGRLFALMEGGKPTELDVESLATLGERDLDGVVVRTFSAHPHRVASLATSFNFGIRYGKTTSLELFALPDIGAARSIGRVQLPWASLVHDFVATETHLVFVICPVELVLWRALTGVGGFAKMFEWKASRGTELIVVPLAEPERVQRIACEPLWVWHFANGFRRGAELVFDLCRYADFSTLDAIARTGQLSAPSLYHRMVLELGPGRVRSEAVAEHGAEFPRVHQNVEGAAHRFAWIRSTVSEGHEGIARVEVETGSVRAWTPAPELEVSEPVIVPRDRDDEAHVWVLVLCHDERREQSCVVVLDGREPEAGPLARAWFDQTIPLSFHGTWLEAA